MVAENQRLHILEMIESGEISAQEGWQRLQNLEPDEAEESDDLAGSDFLAETAVVQPAPDGSSPPSGPPPDFEKWRGFWTIPLWVGVGFAILFGWLMAQAALASSVFWVLCVSLPFALGILLIVVGWGSRTARWLHVRVQQPPGTTPQRIAISFPLPLRFAGWIVRTFRGRIPGIENVDVEAILAVLGSSTNSENPIYIEVDEGDGEKVQIYIG